MTRERFETSIDGYDVELEVYEEEGEPRSDCFIIRDTRRYSYSASLACLMDTGMLTCNRTDAQLAVHPQTIDEIERWALEKGY